MWSYDYDDDHDHDHDDRCAESTDDGSSLVVTSHDVGPWTRGSEWIPAGRLAGGGILQPCM
jgi:hypothetical protein